MQLKSYLPNYIDPSIISKGFAGAAAGSAAGPLGALAGAGLAVGGNLLNTYFTNQSNQANVAAANAANAALWREQSIYNSPAEQMKRLKMAGINPSLIYGQGGIENLAGAPPQMQANKNMPMPAIDPLTAAQVANLNAQTESLEHQTQREDEKQPLTLETLAETLDNLRESTNEINQKIKNLKADEIVAMAIYLGQSLDNQFKSVTFNDAVRSLHQGLLQSKIDFKMSEFELNKAIQVLSYEIAGLDLHNQTLRAGLDISRQQYRQSEMLFYHVMEKAKWEGENAFQSYLNTKAQTYHTNRENSLLDLNFWIQARENPEAFQKFLTGDYKATIGFHYSSLDEAMMDTFNKIHFVFGTGTSKGLLGFSLGLGSKALLSGL